MPFTSIVAVCRCTLKHHQPPQGSVDQVDSSYTQLRWVLFRLLRIRLSSRHYLIGLQT